MRQPMLNPNPDVELCGRVHSAFYLGLPSPSKKLNVDHLYLFYLQQEHQSQQQEEKKKQQQVVM